MTDQVTPATQPEQTVAPTPELRFEMSAGIGKLIEALAKARKAFLPIIKAETNPFFKSKYADLSACIDATKDGLSANGLAVLQPPVFDRKTGTVEVVTLLAHSSGEWIKSILDMPVSKSDAQGVGSAITYGRRYSYSGVLNVASEQDDDGNAAVSKYFLERKKEESNEEFDQRTEGQQCIVPFQITAIDEACKRTGKTEAEILAYLGLIGHKRIEHLLKSEFQEFLKWANSTKSPAVLKPTPGVGEGRYRKSSISTSPALSNMKPASQIAAPDPVQKTMKRLFATANELHIPEGDVKQCGYTLFKVDSLTKLDVPQLEQLIQWVKDVAANASE
jgi:hypothetical protein